MTKSKVIAAFAAIALSLQSLPVMAQQALSADDVAKIKADVIDGLQRYMKAFSTRDLKSMVENVYANPAATFGPNGAALVPSEKTKSNYEGIFADLAKTGYDHTEVKTPAVCVLSATSAIVSGEFQRVKKDGTLLSEFPASFLYGKTPDGWKVTASLGLQKNKRITCE